MKISIYAHDEYYQKIVLLFLGSCSEKNYEREADVSSGATRRRYGMEDGRTDGLSCVDLRLSLLCGW